MNNIFMKDKYYEKAVTCVKDTVLPAQIKLYKSCGGDFDKIYGEAMNGNGYFGKVIEAGHIYELGYEKCTCPKVQSGQVTDPEQCNCSRQSILYILGCLEPNSKFEVEILETILRGAEHCRFQITKHERTGSLGMAQVTNRQFDEPVTPELSHTVQVCRGLRFSDGETDRETDSLG